MKCEICGAAPTQCLTCFKCKRVAAYLCDGAVCQPKVWALGPHERRSSIPLLNLRCEHCDLVLKLERLDVKSGVTGEIAQSSRLLHAIWLRGAVRDEVVTTLGAWVRQADAVASGGVLPVLWLDRAALEANAGRISHANTSLCQQVGAWLPVFGQLNLGSTQRIPCVCVEEWLATSNVPKALQAALLFEASPGGLVQVASDILRILILRRHGGIYIDAGDVGPSREPLSLSRIYTRYGFACRFKRFHGHVYKPENDLIIADHTSTTASKALTEIEMSMASYYESGPKRRLQDLVAAIDERVLGEIEEAIQAFVARLARTPTLCKEYAKLLSFGAIEKGMYALFFNQNIHKSADKFFAALERGINAATMSAFSKVAAACCSSEVWDDLRGWFSDDVNDKEYYSWKTPGLSLVQPLLSEAPSMPGLGLSTDLPPEIRHDAERQMFTYADKRYGYGDDDERDDIRDKLLEAHKAQPEARAKILSQLSIYDV